eukprot:16232-Eustigmatos_ZCMA.PRE.1
MTLRWMLVVMHELRKYRYSPICRPSHLAVFAYKGPPSQVNGTWASCTSLYALPPPTAQPH